MPFNLITDRPIMFVVWILAILIALSAHEFSHALVGTSLGDDTARRAGRLTLNPFAHIDIFGFLMLLFVGFGWGKPVPFNQYNLRYPRWGPTMVALAGPGANFIQVIIFGFIMKAITELGGLPIDNLLVQFLGLLVVINTVLMLFNIIPIPPLDGSKVLLSLLDSPRYARTRFLLETRGPLLLLGLVIADTIFGVNIFGRLFGGVIHAVYRFF